MNKKLYKAKLQYFYFQVENNLKQPACISQVYGEFFFNWSMETCKQFAKHILSLQPTKFYLSSTSEIEALTNKTAIFQKIIDSYSNKKIDKLEFICLIPFIVDDKFEYALEVSLSFFIMENEGTKIITKNELSLFFDCYFRGLHNLLILKESDEIYEKTKNNVLKLSDNEIDEIVNEIIEKESEEINIEEIVK